MSHPRNVLQFTAESVTAWCDCCVTRNVCLITIFRWISGLNQELLKCIRTGRFNMLEGVKQKWGWEVIYVVNWIHVYSFIHRLVRSVPPCLSGDRGRGRGSVDGWLRVPRQEWPAGPRWLSPLLVFFPGSWRREAARRGNFGSSHINITYEWMKHLTRGCAVEY